MAPKDTAFLCLVFCLGQKIWAQEVSEFPIPAISAAPSPVVPWNGSVRILCQGTPEAFLYKLFLMKNSTQSVVEAKLGFQNVAEFIINRMDATMAGSYQCWYKKKQQWSEQSEPLVLVVTGLYDKPVLSTDQSLVVMPGENISFQCNSAHSLFNRFSLLKEGEASLSQLQHENHQGNFNLGPLNPGFDGNYRCYGWHSSSPYVWSAPSDALELVVTDSKQRQDYITVNAIRMGVAAVVLVVLLVLLAEDWHSRRISHKNDCQELAAQRWSKQGVRPSDCG